MSRSPSAKAGACLPTSAPLLLLLGLPSHVRRVHPSLPVCLLLSPKASFLTPHSLGQALPPADASTLQPSLPPAPLPPPYFHNKHVHSPHVHILPSHGGTSAHPAASLSKAETPQSLTILVHGLHTASTYPYPLIPPRAKAASPDVLPHWASYSPSLPLPSFKAEQRSRHPHTPIAMSPAHQLYLGKAACMVTR